MKYFLLLLLVPLAVNAQPYLSGSGKWTNERKYKLVSNTIMYHTYTHYYVNGDSVINNQVYKKIYSSTRNCGTVPWVQGQNYGCQVNPNSPALAVLMREVGQRWYVRTPSGQDSLLYRFDLVKGDSVPVKYSPYYVRIDSVINNYNNSGLKFFRVKDLTTPSFTSMSTGGYLEGVGPTTGFLSTPLFFPFEEFENLICYTAAPTDYSCDWFYYVSLDETADDEHAVLLYPNPSSDNVCLKLPGDASNIGLRLIDVLGRVVYEIENLSSGASINPGYLPAGIYVAEIKNDTRRITTRFIRQ